MTKLDLKKYIKIYSKHIECLQHKIKLLTQELSHCNAQILTAKKSLDAHKQALENLQCTQSKSSTASCEMTMIICAHCSSTKCVKYGFYRSRSVKVAQRYRCYACNRSFKL